MADYWKIQDEIDQLSSYRAELQNRLDSGLELEEQPASEEDEASSEEVQKLLRLQSEKVRETLLFTAMASFNQQGIFTFFRKP